VQTTKETKVAETDTNDSDDDSDEVFELKHKDDDLARGIKIPNFFHQSIEETLRMISSHFSQSH
jgi:hypothetical protein